MMKRLFLFIIFILLPIEVFSQSKDPDKIIEMVMKEFEKIEDYEVDVHLKIDVKFLKMPDTDAHLYFKQPDKIHVESDKFAMLPRQGLSFSPMTLFKDNYTALYEGVDTIQNIPVSVVKVIPVGNESEIVLSTFWIDQARNLIIKIESSRKPSGTFSLEFQYAIVDEKYELPASMEFTFTVDKSILHRGRGLDPDSDDTNIENSGPVLGKVFLTYTNYKVNRGIPDDMFESSQEKSK